jgi:ribulose-5-phosphate 4-epimerase/fuculose-1-phosphate aldolase
MMDHEAVFKKIHAVGSAALTLDIENSHSGNISIKGKDQCGNDMLAITATGSQKGELTREKICFPALNKINYGYFKSSSETDIHTRILQLPGINATMHGHTKMVTVVTLDDAPIPKEKSRTPLIPIDPLGARYLKHVPVDWFPVACGSREMSETVGERLQTSKVTVVQAHGAFAKGASLEEAFFNLCLLEHSGEVLFYSGILGTDLDLAHKKYSDLAPILEKNMPDFTADLDGRVDFADEPDTVEMFTNLGFRAFESRYSPFHAGSVSMRGSSTILYLPKMSLPRELPGPMLEVSLRPGAQDSYDWELDMHRFIYGNSPMKAVVHCYSSEVEALSLYTMQNKTEGAQKIIPIDAEGGFLYPSIPLLPPNPDPDALCRALLEYKVAIVECGGIWSCGEQSPGEAFRHISSAKDISFYRIMAKMRNLNLAAMEPERARNW